MSLFETGNKATESSTARAMEQEMQRIIQERGSTSNLLRKFEDGQKKGGQQALELERKALEARKAAEKAAAKVGSSGPYPRDSSWLIASSMPSVCLSLSTPDDIIQSLRQIKTHNYVCHPRSSHASVSVLQRTTRSHTNGVMLILYRTSLAKRILLWLPT